MWDAVITVGSRLRESIGPCRARFHNPGVEETIVGCDGVIHGIVIPLHHRVVLSYNNSYLNWKVAFA